MLTNPRLGCLPLLLGGLMLITAVRAADMQLDDYVVSAQSECFTSKRIFSCFRYKAARYLWSAASGRMNIFDKDSSRTMSGDSDPVRSSFQFVQLSEPSTALVFPGARQESGDSSTVKLWKFVKRTWATFLNAHGVRFGLDGRLGGRILDADDDDDNGEHSKASTGESRLARRKKWQVIVPLAILGKLMHLKMLMMQVLFGVGVIQVTMVGGAVLLYYYLKHNTICRFEPHVMHSHSHVTDVLPEISSHSAYSTYGGGGGSSGWNGPDSVVAASVQHPYSGHYGPPASVYHKGWDRVYDRPFHVDDINPNH